MAARRVSMEQAHLRQESGIELVEPRAKVSLIEPDSGFFATVV
jgi:hypothetical protein